MSYNEDPKQNTYPYTWCNGIACVIIIASIVAVIGMGLNR